MKRVLGLPSWRAIPVLIGVFTILVVPRLALPGTALAAGPGGGTLWAWGWNGDGQLGDGTTTQRNSPVQVPGLTGVTAVAAGSSHSLAVKSDGTVWAWGQNDYGQLGDGTTTHRNSPVQVQALTGVTAVAGGAYYSLAVKSDGTVWAWGWNVFGQLGDGTMTQRNSPVQVAGLVGVAGVASGGWHGLALKQDGTVWAWGQNDYGQLGDKTTTQRYSPVQVAGLTGVTAVAAGGMYSLAVKSDGTVWAWGANDLGTLGDGTTTDRHSPVQVQALTGVIAVAAGGSHSLAVKSDGTVWAWGWNVFGQLGDGTTTQRNSPVQVPGLMGVTAVAGGRGNHSLAVKSDGTVWAWGANDLGTLGDGTTTDRHSPVQVQALTGVTAIAAGSSHSLAFAAERPSISGRVVDASGSGVSGVTISAGSGISATTDGSGNYSISGLVTGIYTLTPSKSGYAFSPASRTVSVPPDGIAQNFYALADSAVVDPARSSVVSSAAFVQSDGSDSGILTVVLKNAAGAPVSGKKIQLVSSRGSQDIVTQPSGSTDSSGATAGAVRSLTPGSSTIWAWVIGDGLRLSTPATVTFGATAPVPDALRGKASATVARSSKALDGMWADIQAAVNEAIYFRGAIGEAAFRLGSDVVGGLTNAWSGWADWKNGVLASRYTSPGLEAILDSPAWASPALCDLSNAFLKDVAGRSDSEAGRRLSRFALLSGLYYLAAQRDNECLGDLREDMLVEGWNIANLVEGHLEKPVAEWPLKKLLDKNRAWQQTQLDLVNKTRIPTLSQSSIDSYVSDLNARANALPYFQNRLQDARLTLESFHQANTADPWGGNWLQMALRLVGKGLAEYTFDGAGKALVGGSLAAFDTYMDTNALTESVQMAALANSTIAKTAPESIKGAADNIATGLDQIARGHVPNIPRGTISNVQHFSEGKDNWGVVWNEKASYSTMTVRNTGQGPATFQVVSRYLAQTTRLGVPWATLWMHQLANPVTLAPGEARTVRLDYRSGRDGYSPREQQNIFPFGEVPASSISIDLLAIERTGTFFLANDYSQWAPTRLSVSASSTGLRRTSSVSSSPTIDAPIVAYVGSSVGQPGHQEFIWVNNPFSSTIPVTVTQPIPAGISTLDTGSATLSSNQLIWTAMVAPLDTQMFTYTFSISGTPGITLALPAPTLSTISPGTTNVLTDTTDALSVTVPWQLSVSRQTPRFVMPGTAATVTVTATNQLTTPISASFMLTVTTSAGSALSAVTQALSVPGSQSQALSFSLPPTLTVGSYRATGALQSQTVGQVVFDDPFAVGASAPRLSTTASPVASDGTVTAGSTLTFSVVLTNTANLQLTNIVVSNTVPPDIVVLPGNISDGGVVIGNNVSWNVDNLSPGASALLTYNATIPEDYAKNTGGRYVSSRATMTAREVPLTTGQSVTILIPGVTPQTYVPLATKASSGGW